MTLRNNFKKLTIQILYFIIPVIAIAGVAEYFLRTIPNDYSLKCEYLDANSNETEVLILGSSHAFFGINPEYFSRKCFNASYMCQSLKYDYEILKKYENNFENMKTVILSVSYFNLFHNLEKSQESSRVKDYVIYYGMNTSYSLYNNFEIFNNAVGSNFKRLVLYYCYGEKSKYNLSSRLGWGEVFPPEHSKDLEVTGKIAVKLHSKKDLSCINENILILRSIVELCKRKKIEIILITTPAYVTYRENLHEEQYKLTVETAEKIAEEYDNCKYYNWIDDTNFNALDYNDANHLNGQGAKKLSLMLNDLINKTYD